MTPSKRSCPSDGRKCPMLKSSKTLPPSSSNYPTDCDTFYDANNIFDLPDGYPSPNPNATGNDRCQSNNEAYTAPGRQPAKNEQKQQLAQNNDDDDDQDQYLTPSGSYFCLNEQPSKHTTKLDSTVKVSFSTKYNHAKGSFASICDEGDECPHKCEEAAPMEDEAVSKKPISMPGVSCQQKEVPKPLQRTYDNRCPCGDDNCNVYNQKEEIQSKPPPESEQIQQKKENCIEKEPSSVKLSSTGSQTSSFPEVPKESIDDKVLPLLENIYDVLQSIKEQQLCSPSLAAGNFEFPKQIERDEEFYGLPSPPRSISPPPSTTQQIHIQPAPPFNLIVAPMQHESVAPIFGSYDWPDTPHFIDTNMYVMEPPVRDVGFEMTTRRLIPVDMDLLATDEDFDWKSRVTVKSECEFVSREPGICKETQVNIEDVLVEDRKPNLKAVCLERKQCVSRKVQVSEIMPPKRCPCIDEEKKPYIETCYRKRDAELVLDDVIKKLGSEETESCTPHTSIISTKISPPKNMDSNDSLASSVTNPCNEGLITSYLPQMLVLDDEIKKLGSEETANFTPHILSTKVSPPKNMDTNESLASSVTNPCNEKLSISHSVQFVVIDDQIKESDLKQTERLTPHSSTVKVPPPENVTINHSLASSVTNPCTKELTIPKPPQILVIDDQIAESDLRETDRITPHVSSLEVPQPENMTTNHSLASSATNACNEKGTISHSAQILVIDDQIEESALKETERITPNVSSLEVTPPENMATNHSLASSATNACNEKVTISHSAQFLLLDDQIEKSVSEFDDEDQKCCCTTCRHCQQARERQQQETNKKQVRENSSRMENFAKLSLTTESWAEWQKLSNNLSYPVTIEKVQELGANSLFVKWKVDDYASISGYEIYLDGHLTNRYFNCIYRSAVISQVNLQYPHTIMVRAQRQKSSELLTFLSKVVYPPTTDNIEASCTQANSSVWYPSVYHFEPNFYSRTCIINFDEY